MQSCDLGRNAKRSHENKSCDESNPKEKLGVEICKYDFLYSYFKIPRTDGQIAGVTVIIPKLLHDIFTMKIPSIY
jgi:hypothetical protein